MNPALPIAPQNIDSGGISSKLRSKTNALETGPNVTLIDN
jgi:hypothetical protein